MGVKASRLPRRSWSQQVFFPAGILPTITHSSFSFTTFAEFSKKTLCLLPRRLRMRRKRWTCLSQPRRWRWSLDNMALLGADFMINLTFSQVVDNHGVINIDAEDVGNPQLVSLVDDISCSPAVIDFLFRSRAMSTRSTATYASWKRNRMWRRTTSLDRRWWVIWTVFIISPIWTAPIKTSLIPIVLQEILPKMRAVLVDWMVITSRITALC